MKMQILSKVFNLMGDRLVALRTWSFFTMLLMLFASNVEASLFQQKKTVTGTVIDNSGVPVVGANVIVDGAPIGTITDFDGKFQLDLPSDIAGEITVVVSYVGFKPVRNTIDTSGSNVSLNVTLVSDLLSLQEVVITGNSNPKTKLESSVAITTIGPAEIEQRVPRSNADLLKAVPGLWVESTGGEGPANVWVRGFPQGGGYTYIGLMEDGLPVFQGGYSTTPSPDQFYKADLNIKNVEAIRGGTAPVVMQGAAGAVINNISKTGTDNFKGAAKLTYSPVQDLVRADLNIGGPLGNRFYYNVGGFYRTDQGIYDLGYAGNKGGQVKANIVKRFDSGFIKLYAKHINDRVNWNLTTPYTFQKNGDIGDIPGFDQKSDGAALNAQDTDISFTLPTGDTFDFDLRDGFHTNMFSTGLEFNFKLGDNWRFSNKTRVDNIDFNTNVDLILAITPLDPAIPYTYSDGTQVTDVSTLNGNGLGLMSVAGSGKNNYKNFINRFELFNNTDKNSLTLGFEYFNYQQESSSVGATFTKELTDQPRILINPLDPFAQNGITPSALFNPAGITKANGKENTYSFYISNEYEVSDAFRLDAGFRFDSKSVDGEQFLRDGGPVIDFATFQPTGLPGFFLSDDTVSFDDSQSNWVATLGANYKFNEKSALFGRFNRSYNSIKLGDYTSDNADFDALEALDDRTIYQAEIGYKYGSQKFALFSSLLYAKVNDAVSSVAVPNSSGTALITVPVLLSTRTISAEVEAQYKLTDNLLLKWITTYQNAEYSDYSFEGPADTPFAGQTISFEGNKAERVPSFISDFTISYNKKRFNAFFNYRSSTNRWSTAANNIQLKGFSEAYAGMGYKFTDKLALNVSAANLFNTVALTEANIRGGQFADLDVLDGNPSFGRRILPFTIFTNLTFEF